MSEYGSMRSLVGWKAIAEFFGCSVNQIRRHRDELHQCGVIFYIKHGRPPARRVHAFPIKLMAWQGILNKKGRII